MATYKPSVQEMLTQSQFSGFSSGNYRRDIPQDCDYSLIDACLNGDYDGAQNALNHGANPRGLDRYYINIVRGLPDSIYNYPMRICIAKGHEQIAQLLHSVDNGIIGDRLSFDGSFALHTAAENNCVKICQWLLSLNANINVYDKLGRTPLMLAASNTALETLKCLLEDNEIAILALDKENLSALSFCIDCQKLESNQRHIDCIQLLLESGANINDCGPYTKRNVLHVAVIYQDMKWIKQLMESKESKYLIIGTDIDGKTALDYAIKTENKEIIMYLSDRAAVNMRQIECSCVML